METDRQISKVRTELIAEIVPFVQRVKRIYGVIRIALIGSLTTNKPNPKDIDLPVSVTESADLVPLAGISRRMNGHVQGFNHNADVFLNDARFHYIGRVCLWKKCAPGIRFACDALHCGRRKYLHDDLATITLKKELVQNPQLELWPDVIRRVPVPPDVEKILLSSLTDIITPNTGNLTDQNGEKS